MFIKNTIVECVMIPLLMLFYFMTFFHIILIVIILKINGENKIALYSFQGDNKKLSYKKNSFQSVRF